MSRRRRPRKPVAASVVHHGYLVIICDDGSVWGDLEEHHNRPCWIELQPIPGSTRSIQLGLEKLVGDDVGDDE